MRTQVPRRLLPADDPLPDRVAVIDLGSGSATLALYRRSKDGLEVVDEVTCDLGLMRLVDRRGTLGPEGFERTLSAMRALTRKARLFDAERIEAIATSAVRDLEDSDALVAAVRDETGVDLRVISGEEEARLAVSASADILPHT